MVDNKYRNYKNQMEKCLLRQQVMNRIQPNIQTACKANGHIGVIYVVLYIIQ